MKKIVKSAILLCSIFFLTATLNAVLSQPAPPPPPSGGHGQGGNQGQSAPIDGGLTIALAMVAGYGAWKGLQARRKNKPFSELRSTNDE